MAQSRPNPANAYPTLLAEVEAFAYIHQYQGQIHPIQEDKIKYYILTDNRIIIYSELIKQGYLYPLAEPFIRGYHPSYVQFNPLIKDLQLEHFLDMDKYLSSYLADLEQILDVTIDIANDDPAYLEQLSGRIREYVDANGYQKLFIPLYVYIGEKVRRRCGGIWTLELVVSLSVCHHVVIIKNPMGKKVKYYAGSLQDDLDSEFRTDLSFRINWSLKE